MVAIGKTHPQRSAIDYTIYFCLTIVLLLVIILIDAYEYVSVPGAKHASNHIRTGVNLAGEKLHTGVESITGLELMTKAEKEEMRREVEEAKEVVRKKHDEVEEIVEEVEILEKEAHKPAATPDAPAAPVAVVTAQEKAVEEEKKEVIVEEMVEKQLGLEKWCGDCKWKDMGFTCDQRVSYMIEKYEISEVEAKEANINHCSNARRLRA